MTICCEKILKIKYISYVFWDISFAIVSRHGMFSDYACVGRNISIRGIAKIIECEKIPNLELSGIGYRKSLLMTLFFRNGDGRL